MLFLSGLIILGCVKLCSMIMMLFSLAITVLITCNVLFCTAKISQNDNYGLSCAYIISQKRDVLEKI